MVQYIASVSHRDRTTQETFVASVGRRVPPETAIVTVDGLDVAIWRLPHDPFLPGLAPASDPASAARLLRQVGAEGRVTRLRRRSYRPGRRAVMEISTEAERVFAKVVRPSKVAALQHLHTELTRFAPIPRSLGWSESTGIAMLQALSGQSLRREIELGTADLPSPESLLRLLDDIGGAEAPPGVRARLVDRVSEHAAFISEVEPDLRARVDALAETVARHEVPETTRTIHGDFHAAQIMLEKGAITGLVDIDTVSTGECSDDLANLLAHLAAMGAADPALEPRVAAYGSRLIHGFDAITDPRQLRLRIAASLVGYATGPFRVQEPGWRAATDRRIALAEDWTEAALDAH